MTVCKIVTVFDFYLLPANTWLPLIFGRPLQVTVRPMRWDRCRLCL